MSTDLAATTNGIVVTTFADVINPMDGLISLREAILANNNSPGNNTIVLGAGTYTLSLQGAGTEAGDFDIFANLNIVGLGAGRTIIDAKSIDRIFEVSPNVVLKLSDLTITNGSASGANGGAIYNQGTVNLSKVTVSNNKSIRWANNPEQDGIKGGAIFNADGGILGIIDSTFSDNYLQGKNGYAFTGEDGRPAFGGAIYNSVEGIIDIKSSSFLRNIAQGGEGGIGRHGVNAPPRSFIIPGGPGGDGGNGGDAQGGAIFNEGSLSVTQSTFADNQSLGGLGGAGGTGGWGHPPGSDGSDGQNGTGQEPNVSNYGFGTAEITYITLQGTANNDTLEALGLHSKLLGLGGNDTLIGGEGNDTLDGGVSFDSMRGDKGNDTYVVSSPGDAIIENVNEGIDTVQSPITYSLEILLNLENLTLTGTGNINGTGNGLNNILTGNAGNNILTGGDGNDTYKFDTDTVLGSDRLTDGAGIDTINFASTTTKAVRINLGSTAAQVVTPGNLTLTLTSASTFENITGGSLNDTLTGNSLNNSLSGGSGNDSLNGGIGNDILVGGQGKDILMGGTGQDTFTYNALTESLLASFDVVKDYSGSGASPDRINAPSAIPAVSLTASKGTAASLSQAAIQAVLTNAVFGANTAAAFKVTGQSGTFIALNNGVAGFQAATDAILQLEGYNINGANPVVII